MHILHLFNTDDILYGGYTQILYYMTIDTLCIVVYIILSTRNKQ